MGDEDHSWIYQLVDANHDGEVTRIEWAMAFNAIDVDGDGAISRKEWVLQNGTTTMFDAIPKQHKAVVRRPEWLAAFANFDKDGNGTISLQEWLHHHINGGPPKDQHLDVAPPHVDSGGRSSFNMAASSSSSIEVLLAQALQCPLPAAQTQAVLSGLEKERVASLVIESGLKSRRFPGLVEHNPAIAGALLVKLMATPQANDYLAVLTKMELSKSSIEAVSRFTEATPPTPEFVQSYASYCLTAHKAIKDREMQAGVIRSVCTLFQTWFGNKILTDAALVQQVQDFCIEFSRIREASALFKTMKLAEK